MRPIKFRGIRLLSNDWEYGNLIQRPDGGHFIEIGDLRLCPVQDFSIGQFTGLLDKNGKEIYEGDIVKCDRFVYEVVFEEKRFASYGLHRKEDMFMHYFGEAMESQQCEVIGNIHDNPELIEKGK